MVVLSRTPDPTLPYRCVEWDGETQEDWTTEIEGSDAVINLAGRSVNCRYNERNRRIIRESRVRSTYVLGESISKCNQQPKVWLNSSTATIYRHAEDRPMDEEVGEIGTGFSVGVATDWERALNNTETPNTRKVALRTAMVMGPGKGGPYDAYRSLVKHGLGGKMGNGNQMVSWVHIDDLARAIEFLIESDLEGPVNIAAPGPMNNRAFMRTIAESYGKRIALPSPVWMLKLGALLLGTETELPLKSLWVIPTRLTEAGFKFHFDNWSEAAKELAQ